MSNKKQLPKEFQFLEGEPAHKELEEAILDGNWPSEYPGEDYNCNICRIDKYPWREAGENIRIREEEGKHYIVETIDKKGHNTRLMAVYKQCGELPNIDEINKMKNDLKKWLRREAGDRFYIGGSMNSEQRHYHIIGGGVNVDPDAKGFPDFTIYNLNSESSDEIKSKDYIESYLGEILLGKTDY